MGRNFLTHQAVDKLANVVFADAIGNVGAACDGTHQSHGGMTAVEHAQFGFFIAVNIGGDAHPTLA